MQKTIYPLLTLLFLFVLTSLRAQAPMGLYYMETIPQSSFINPAMQSRANGFFALPSLNQNFKSDIAFKSIFQDAGSEWVTPLSKRYDFSKLKRSAGQAVNLQEAADIGLMGLGFRSGRDYFTLNLSVKTVAQSGIPYDILRIADKGFPSGSVFDFSTTQIKGYAYKEIALGYSREWNDKLTLGIKIKPLFGMMGATTDIKSFQLKTSRQAWEVTVAGSISTSAPLEIIEAATANDFPESVDFKNLASDDLSNYLTSFNNSGIALDFGAVYALNKRWSFSAALVNLGYLKWKDDLNTLSFSGEYSFDGLDVDASDDDLDAALEILEEDFKTLIDYKVSHDKFSTSLSPELYAGTLYEVTPSLTLGVLARSIFQKNNYRQDFNFSANIQPYSFVALNLNYSLRPGGGNGLGTAVSILMGPLQLYVAADYLPTQLATVNIDGDELTMFPNARNLTVKMGLNLIFGRHGNRDKPMLARGQ
ncbi:hypothetical protein SAMN06265379_104195 [Saccharicrinis carchari]|uniref:DUF5723 domain-containing protein n=1 Tax=Saccharicrinis carchari TaxID=1168039 RepID=A0A521D3Y3_SACCC|nr:DUF5723 family protein [Saccharicrinis carchari]SMO66405.1 hypothetical protein SAMN06265379_104195 [Saccharicrinis carchari]